MNPHSPPTERAGRAGLALSLYLAICVALPALALAPDVPLDAFRAGLVELLMLPVLIWLLAVRIRAHGKGRGRDAVHGSLPVAPLVLLAATWLISTAFAWSPAVAILGGATRGRGLLFWLACVVGMAAATQTGRRQRVALIWTIISVALVNGCIWEISLRIAPTAHSVLYSFLAKGGTFGNPSFLRDYLAVAGCLAFMIFDIKHDRFSVILRWLPVLGFVPFAIWSLMPARAGAVEYRLNMWRSVLPAIAASPVVGYGPENQAAVVEVYSREAVPQSYFPDRTENLLLDAALERGLPGMAAEALFWIAVLWRGRRSIVLPALVVQLALSLVSVMSVPGYFVLYVLAGIACCRTGTHPIASAGARCASQGKRAGHRDCSRASPPARVGSRVESVLAYRHASPHRGLGDGT